MVCQQPLIKWFDNYLSNRKQRVVINGKSSSWKTINAGVPQGSVLGPLLFLIYINDIGSNLSCKTTLFADGTTISKHITNQMATTNELQYDLTIIEDWADKWKVKFNPLKSEGLLIPRRFDRVESLFTFQKPYNQQCATTYSSRAYMEHKWNLEKSFNYGN